MNDPYEDRYAARTREIMSKELPTIDKLVGLSEGNPGAANVLALLSREVDETKYFNSVDELAAKLDSMNLRGPALWIAYKEWALHEKGWEGRKAHERLLEHIYHDSAELIQFLNDHRGVKHEVEAGHIE